MLEFIAIPTMIIDHVGIIFYPHDLIFRIIGRMSFVIYAYLLAVGAKRTSNKKKYLLRILISAIISQWVYYSLISHELNVCFTLSAGLLVIIIYESNILRTKRYFLIMSVFVIAMVIGFDYGVYGICVIFAFYYFSNRPMKDIVVSQIIVLAISCYIFGISMVQYVSLIALMFIAFVQNKSPRYTKISWRIRYVNYLIYPIHLIILLVLKEVTLS